jgi:hypothetical protein
MANQEASNANSAMRALMVVAVLAGTAAVANAGWRPWRWRRRPVRVVRRPVVVKRAPVKTVVVPARVVRPAPAPVVTVVSTEPATADELKAEIARLKAKHAKLSQTRRDLRSWLDGPGKRHSAAGRARVRVRLAAVERERTAVAARIAKLEEKLADL